MECWCGKHMKKNGKISGKQRYICPKGHTMFERGDYEPETKRRIKRLSDWWFK